MLTGELLHGLIMPVARTYSRAQVGIDAPLVTVEADLASGLPQIIIVGLPETAVRESKDRVKSALNNAGFTLPSRRVTINLAPADLPKQGGAMISPSHFVYSPRLGSSMQRQSQTRSFWVSFP